MKYSVKDPAGRSFEIDIPDSVFTRLPAPGEFFEVRLAGAQAPLRAAFLGDGESVLVGTQVVRLPRSFHAGKRGAFRFRFGAAGAPRTLNVTPVRPVEPKRTAASLGGGPLKSPMTGKVLAVNAAEGSAVKEGDVLVVIEAMKMENRILCECDGTVRSVSAKPGHAVATGDVLLVVEPSLASAET